jgi:3-dehydrosphinganine reductase
MTQAETSTSSQRVHYISADLTKPEENTRILEEATTWNHGSPPDIVWANAGSSHPTLFAETPLGILHSQMDIDYWAAAYLAHATINLWTKPTGSSKATSDPELPRHFIITSSVVAFIGLAGYAPYAPAKSALRSLSDTLRSELNLYNGARRHASDPLRVPEIRNHIILPGNIKSPGFEAENKLKHPVTSMLEESDPCQSEDECAAAAIKGLEKGGYMITTQLLGGALRAGALGASPRNGWGVVDTLFGWVVYVVMLFVSPDLESKVFKWGEKNGMAGITQKSTVSS